MAEPTTSSTPTKCPRCESTNTLKTSWNMLDPSEYDIECGDCGYTGTHEKNQFTCTGCNLMIHPIQYILTPDDPVLKWYQKLKLKFRRSS